MSDRIEITSNAREVADAFDKSPAKVQDNILLALRRVLLTTETDVVRKAALKWRRGGAGLGGRITSFAQKDEVMGFEAAIGFRNTKGFPYELSQEFGAKAAPGKAMAIPVTPQARAAGSPRNFQGKLFIPCNTHVLASFSKGLGTFQTQYVLVKSIPARLNFRRTVISNIPKISEAIVDGANKGWDEVSALTSR